MLVMCAATMLGNSEGFRLSGKSLGQTIWLFEEFADLTKEKEGASLITTHLFLLPAGRFRRGRAGGGQTP